MTLFVLLVLVALIGLGAMLVFQGDSEYPDVLIKFNGMTNLPARTNLAVFIVRNDGKRPLRRVDTSTVSWTNREGKWEFVLNDLSPTYSILKSGSAELLVVSPPPVEAYWKANFGFKLEPRMPQRMFALLMRCFSRTPSRTSNYETLRVFDGPQMFGDLNPKVVEDERFSLKGFPPLITAHTN